MLILMLINLTVVSEREFWQRVKKNYLEIKTITGDFFQRQCEKESGICSEFFGKFWFKKPHYLRVDIFYPDTQSIISDGESLYFYSSKEEVRTTPYLTDPPPFLIFLSLLSDTVFPTIKEAQKNYYLLSFKQENLGFSLTLRVHKKHLIIDNIEVCDQIGNSTEIGLIKQRFNKKLSSKLFKPH